MEEERQHESSCDPLRNCRARANDDLVQLGPTPSAARYPRYSAGTYEMTATDSATHKVINDHGSYVTTYRKQADGSWRAVADIATSAVPPTPPAKKK